jgi:hypothetical protein
LKLRCVGGVLGSDVNRREEIRGKFVGDLKVRKG